VRAVIDLVHGLRGAGSRGRIATLRSRSSSGRLRRDAGISHRSNVETRPSASSLIGGVALWVTSHLHIVGGRDRLATTMRAGD
jgi:hypothetical protein